MLIDVFTNGAMVTVYYYVEYMNVFDDYDLVEKFLIELTFLILVNL